MSSMYGSPFVSGIEADNNLHNYESFERRPDDSGRKVRFDLSKNMVHTYDNRSNQTDNQSSQGGTTDATGNIPNNYEEIVKNLIRRLEHQEQREGVLISEYKKATMVINELKDENKRIRTHSIRSHMIGKLTSILLIFSAIALVVLRRFLKLRQTKKMTVA